MGIFFTSDTHFNQDRTLTLSKRPFKDVDEMNDVLVFNWNKEVGPDDDVYHLGDFGDISFAEKLNGNIHLIAGNYELRDYTVDELTSVFHGVVTLPQLTLQEGGEILRLVHEPSNSDFKTFTLFGHIHKLQMVKRNGLNVGVDCHNFKPISIDDILFYKNAIDKFYDNEVFSPGRFDSSTIMENLSDDEMRDLVDDIHAHLQDKYGDSL